MRRSKSVSKRSNRISRVTSRNRSKGVNKQRRNKQRRNKQSRNKCLCDSSCKKCKELYCKKCDIKCKCLSQKKKRTKKR